MRKNSVSPAGTLGTASFAADREIKVDERLNVSADTCTT